MPDLEWFNRGPNELPNKPTDDGGHMMVIGSQIGNYIRLPAELGGMSLKVLDVFEAPCPASGELCRHLKLEQGFYVAESDRFYWYKHKE